MRAIIDAQKKRNMVSNRIACWLSTLKTTRQGGGYVQVLKTNSTYKSCTLHELSYVYRNGPVPDNLQVSHLCGNTTCFNPDHLVAETAIENNRRKGCSNARVVRCKAVCNRIVQTCPHTPLCIRDYCNHNNSLRCLCLQVHSQSLYCKCKFNTICPRENDAGDRMLTRHRARLSRDESYVGRHFTSSPARI